MSAANMDMPWLQHYGSIPHHIDYPDASMYELVRRAAETYPNTTAWEFEGRRVSYRRFLTRIDNTARALLAFGIVPGEPVILALPNCPQTVELFYALNRIGAVANMVHPLSAIGEIRRYATISGSRVAITLESFVPKFYKAVPQLRIISTRISDTLSPAIRPLYRILQESKYHRQVKSIPHTPWTRFLACGRNRSLPDPTRDCRQTAVILYSGGTTGTTKGIAHTDEAFNAAGLQTMAANHFSHAGGHRMLAVLPNFHGFGLGIGIHAAFIHGCTVMLMPRFSAKGLIRLLRRKPSYLTGVPTMFEALLRVKAPRGLDLSALRGVYSGGDSLPEELKARFDAFLAAHGAHVTLREGYGATECVAACCLSPETGAKPGSIGIPFPDIRITICAPGTVDALPPGEEGEICISGPTIMRGYLNDSEGSSLALQQHPDGRVWLHTGDLGHMDSDGFFYFSARIKRMIVTSGYNVYPGELERIFARHQKVAASCVVGVQDDYRMQRIRAFIVPAPGVPVDDTLLEEITAYAKDNIAKYALPREYIFLDALPTTPLGKIDYRALENR